MQITMAHGSGGAATSELIKEIFLDAFGTQDAEGLEDAAVVSAPAGMRLALTTDSFVVTPLEFPGGDIGRLAVCGTVNDLLMRGAVPKYLTCGYILQEGLELTQLSRIVRSMAKTAREAGVDIVAGDTKVVEGCGGLMINTAGVGFVPGEVDISAANIRPGDAVLVSGCLGDHHAAILGSRMHITNDIQSDNAPLVEMVQGLLRGSLHVHCLRDVTRGGLATVLRELSESSGVSIRLWEEALPVSRAVQDFCGLLGLEPLYMGNEGKLVCFVPAQEAKEALAILRGSRYGQDAAIIGEVGESSHGEVLMETSIGGLRRLEVLQGEGLPRIC